MFLLYLANNWSTLCMHVQSPIQLAIPLELFSYIAIYEFTQQDNNQTLATFSNM